MVVYISYDCTGREGVEDVVVIECKKDQKVACVLFAVQTTSNVFFVFYS